MKEKKTIAWILGKAFGTILVVCASVVVIGLTFKFLMWLF